MRARGFLVGLGVGLALLGAVWGLQRSRAPALPPNLLLVVLDDVGSELLGAYGRDGRASTPTLDGLAARGVRFDVAYALPVCSPTRAALLTGRMPRAFGLGGALHLDRETAQLPRWAVTVAELLRRAPVPYHTAFVGKWHLTPLGQSGVASEPLRHGFDRFVGNLGNLSTEHATDGRPQGYTDWERIVDGDVARSKVHATTQTIDDALAVVAQLPEPWLLVVAPHAVHTPWHDPPGTPPDPGGPGRDARRVRAMLEHVDRELGRLLGGLGDAGDRTVVFATSDNGSPDNAGVARFANRPAKSTVWELGVRVPLLVAGPGVASGQHTRALGHVVDVAPTMLALAGVAPGSSGVPFDGFDLSPVLADPTLPGPRTTVVSEVFVPNGPGPYERWDIAVRDARFKLLRIEGEPPRLYRLDERLVEPAPLVEPYDAETTEARTRLLRALGELGAPRPEVRPRPRRRATTPMP